MTQGSGFTTTIPTTLLEAVNTMLAGIGLAQIASLGIDDLTEDAGRALQEISETSRAMQSQGWYFNTEEGLELQPNTDGEVLVPNNAASVVLNPRSFRFQAVERGGKLYDLDNHTFKWATPLYVDIKLMFEFEDLPQPAKWYVMCKAGTQFATGRLPDTTIYKFTSTAAAEAWSALQQYDQDARGQNLTTSSPHFARFRRGQRSSF